MIDHRRDMAKRVGADVTFDPVSGSVPESISEDTNGRGADLAIVATGNPKAIQQAVAAVRKGGRVILFGAPPRGAVVSLDVSKLFLREIGFQSSYSTSETEMRMALDLIDAGKIRPSLLITHRLPLERASEALSLAERGSKVVKVIVQNQ
jgi:L-iditol 2-dehydrogenase